jgi:hypothetical protein
VIFPKVLVTQEYIHCEYEEFRILGHQDSVGTSQETHYLSATETNRLMLCNILGFNGCECDEGRLQGCYAVWLL